MPEASVPCRQDSGGPLLTSFWGRRSPVSGVLVISQIEERLRSLQPEKRQLLVEKLRERGMELPLRIFPLLRVGDISIAENQRRLWFIHQLDAGAGYHIPVFAKLDGPVDLDALRFALDHVTRRQQSLRTAFVRDAEGEPIAVVRDDVRLELEVEQGRDHDEHELLAQLAEFANRPFDLAEPPLARTRLIELGPDEHLFVIVFHHIVSDGWSSNVFIAELIESYRAHVEGRAPALEPLEVEYQDVVAWREQQDHTASRNRWKEELTGFEPLEIPAMSADDDAGESEASIALHTFTPSLSSEVRSLASALGVTPYVVFNTAMKFVLGHYADQRDVTIGNTVAGRDHAMMEGIIGYFSTAVVSRTRFHPTQTVEELLRAEAEKAADLADHHGHFPLEELAEELRLSRTARTNSFFDAMLVFQNIRPASMEMADVTVSFWDGWSEVPHEAMFDWYVEIYDAPEKFSGLLMHRRSHVDARAATDFWRHLGRTLEIFASAPNARLADLEIFAPEVSWEKGPGGIPDRRPFVSRIAEIADAEPDSIAVVDGDREVSYGELVRWAAGLANLIHGRGIRPGARVGVCARRSVELIAGLLATSMARCAYVPLEPDLPRDRLAFLIRDARTAVVLCDESGRDALTGHDVETASLSRQSGDEDEEFPTKPSPHDVAYVIYTSGSTGRPKGVAVSHASVSNHLDGKIRACSYDSSDVFLCRSSFSFDASVTEIFVPLTLGAKLVVARPGGQRDPRYLSELISRHRISVVETVPSGLALLMEEPAFATCSSLRSVVLGGEALSPQIRDRFHQTHPQARLFNPYGPTEATVEATMKECGAPEHEVTIGNPMQGVSTFVLDAWGRRQPARVPGELFIAGSGVAQGYLGRPRLTAESFLPCELTDRPGERAYRSGDFVAWLENGDIRYDGRKDHQLQIRGVRAELGEIEVVMRSLEGVEDVVVVPVNERAGRADGLIAFVVRR